MAEDRLAMKLLERAKTAFDVRLAHDSLWQDIAEFMLPSRASFTDTNSPLTDSIRRINLADTMAEQAAESCQQGLLSHLVPLTQRWFIIAPPPSLLESGKTLRWLAAVHDVMYSIFNDARAGWPTAIATCLLDFPVLGNCSMFVGERKGSLYFSARHIGEMAIETATDQRPRTFFRKYRMRASDVATTWGIDKLPEAHVRALAEGKEPPKLCILHALLPREQYDDPRIAGFVLPTRMPIASIYVLEESKVVLQEGGFEEDPLAYARWSVHSGDDYGYGPGIRALPLARMSNAMYKTILKGAQKVVDPPLQVPEFGFLNPLRTFPGALNYMRGGSNNGTVQPIETRGRIELGDQLLTQVHDRIKAIFLNDVFDITEDSTGVNVKAAFTLSRRDDKFRKLAGINARFKAEFLDVVVNRVYSWCSRNGLFPPAPDELAKAKLSVSYQSPIERAQRTGEVDDIARWLELMSAIGQFDKSAFMVLDGEKASRVMGTKLLNVPGEIIRGADEVQAMKDQEAQRQQLAEAVQLGQGVAGALKDGAAARRDLAGAGATT